ncbi:probable serine/threonine-protein phosphatase 2A regulatory subunit B'' subunit TON2 [Tanacetum coccineum]
MVDEFENDGFIINDLNDDEEGKPDIDDEKQKKRRKKRSKRNMVLDDDDYEVIEENNPGFHCHTSENCKRLKKVRTDDGCGGDSNGRILLPDNRSKNLLAASSEQRCSQMTLSAGRSYYAMKWEFAQRRCCVAELGIGFLQDIDTEDESVRIRAFHIEKPKFLIVVKVAFHKPYIRGLIANFAQLRDMPAEFIQMYCHIAAHKFFSLCDPVRRVLFEEFLYREARRIKRRCVGINGVAPVIYIAQTSYVNVFLGEFYVNHYRKVKECSDAGAGLRTAHNVLT